MPLQRAFKLEAKYRNGVFPDALFHLMLTWSDISGIFILQVQDLAYIGICGLRTSNTCKHICASKSVYIILKYIIYKIIEENSLSNVSYLFTRIVYRYS